MSKENFIKDIHERLAANSNYGHKLEVMMTIQDSLNKRVNADWRNGGYKWRSAIMVEAVELFDHLNWKWWKSHSSSPDWPQVNMEAVDIWHFILSELVAMDNPIVTTDVVDMFRYSFSEGRGTEDGVSFCVRQIIQDSFKEPYDPNRPSAMAVVGFNNMVGSFVDLTESLGMSFDDLYKLYVGKAKLNELRWANGYGSTYIKNWGGQEDNQFLSELLTRINVDADDFAEQVEVGLAQRYGVIQRVAAGKAEREAQAQRDRIEEIL